MTNEPFALEHSQHSEDSGKYCYHIGTLKNALEHNISDYFYNNRGPNKWQIIFIGPDFASCSAALQHFAESKRAAKAKPAA